MENSYSSYDYKLLYDKIIRDKNYLLLNNDKVCILLQLRHTLSLRHVP